MYFVCWDQSKANFMYIIVSIRISGMGAKRGNREMLWRIHPNEAHINKHEGFMNKNGASNLR